ncbi:hypothetical protein RHSIM_Rhsim13G0174600 [Rhododendron simsii]|uniref:Uncharacterized protein n=1 Tax=Rhododendron simsii TaxID=118357 RepID=A0A834G457_RHOSS|nr:hypothetical protein RHSIM_Rhsim13G0174600 [Rhododendron simsii]
MLVWSQLAKRIENETHDYQIPSNDCFAHLEVQLKFIGGLSPEVNEVLGRTYWLDFENPAKPGVAMAAVGGEDKYRTTSILSADCGNCVFSNGEFVRGERSMGVEYGSSLDCTSGIGGGSGIVCGK